MTFFSRDLQVEAQQYSDPNRPEDVTLVRLEPHTTPSQGAIYRDDTSSIAGVVLPGEWVVRWDDGTISIHSDADFCHRFRVESEVASLKATIEHLASCLTIQGVKKALEEYHANA